LGAEGSAGAITLASTPAANPAATLNVRGRAAGRRRGSGLCERAGRASKHGRSHGAHDPEPGQCRLRIQIGADAATSAANLVAALPPGSTIAGVQSKPGQGR
jgi:hypothetical protein